MQQNKRIVQYRAFVAIAIVLLVAILLSTLMVGVIYAPNYRGLVNSAAEKYGLDGDVVLAMMRQESGFDRRAVSPKGAQGLMQLMPTTAEWLAQKYEIADYDLFSPQDNVEIACIYIRYLFQKYNDYGVVIVAYNAGEGRVDDWLSVSENALLDNIPFKESRNYYKKVMHNWNVYKILDRLGL